MDADDQKDLARIRAYARKYRGISPKLCEKLYDEVNLPAHIRAHCMAVGGSGGLDGPASDRSRRFSGYRALQKRRLPS